MTTDYIFRNTIENFRSEFPELSGQLPDINGEICDVFELTSPKGNMVMKLFLSDRVNVRWEIDGLKLGGSEGFFICDIIELIREIVSEKKVFAIYQTDLNLASKHNVAIPKGVPIRPMCQLISVSAIPESNSEYYYTNKISLVSWVGTKNKEFYAPYHQ